MMLCRNVSTTKPHSSTHYHSQVIATATFNTATNCNEPTLMWHVRNQLTTPEITTEQIEFTHHQQSWKLDFFFRQSSVSDRIDFLLNISVFKISHNSSKFIVLFIPIWHRAVFSLIIIIVVFLWNYDYVSHEINLCEIAFKTLPFGWLWRCGVVCACSFFYHQRVQIQSTKNCSAMMLMRLSPLFGSIALPGAG